jgi:hypothetical protein
MSGYIASARIDRSLPRYAAAWAPPGPVADADVGPAPAAAAWIEVAPEDSASGGLDVRWTAFRERWSQLTFFLLDPDSWR